MIINWVREKGKNIQDAVSSITNYSIVDDMPDCNESTSADANLDASSLYSTPFRPGEHSHTHTNSY